MILSNRNAHSIEERSVEHKTSRRSITHCIGESGGRLFGSQYPSSQFYRQRVYPFSKQASVWLRYREINKPATEPGMLHWLENRLCKILCALIICFTHLRRQWTAQTPATSRADSWLQPPAEQESESKRGSHCPVVRSSPHSQHPHITATATQTTVQKHPHLPLAGRAFLEQQQPSPEPVMLQHLYNIISGKSLIPYIAPFGLIQLCSNCVGAPFTLRNSSHIRNHVDIYFVQHVYHLCALRDWDIMCMTHCNVVSSTWTHNRCLWSHSFSKPAESCKNSILGQTLKFGIKLLQGVFFVLGSEGLFPLLWLVISPSLSP